MFTAGPCCFSLSWDHSIAIYNTQGELLSASYRRGGRLVRVAKAHVNKVAYFRRQGENEMRLGSPMRARALAAMNAAREELGMTLLDLAP